MGGTSLGPQAFLDNLGVMFTRWDNQALNVTTMFASDENVAVFGDFRYKSHSLGKMVSSPFSILVKVTDAKVTYPQSSRTTTPPPPASARTAPGPSRPNPAPSRSRSDLDHHVSVTAVQGAPTAMTIRQLPVVGRPTSPPDPAAQDRHRGALHRPRAGPSQLRGLLSGEFGQQGSSYAGFNPEFADVVSARPRDLRDGRIEEMDTPGIDVAVLSHTIGGVEGISDPAVAVDTARRVNDFLAAEVVGSGCRLADFATVAPQDVAAAVKELTRAVTNSGSAEPW